MISVDFKHAVDLIKTFLEPVVDRIITGIVMNNIWDSKNKEWN